MNKNKTANCPFIAISIISPYALRPTLVGKYNLISLSREKVNNISDPPQKKTIHFSSSFVVMFFEIVLLVWEKFHFLTYILLENSR